MIKETVHSIKLAPVQYAVNSLATPLVLNHAYNALENFHEGNQPGMLVNIGLGLLFTGFIAANIKLIRERRDQYRHQKRLFERFGWDERIIEPGSDKLCARNVSRIAATEAGFEKQYHQYYQDNNLSEDDPLAFLGEE